MRNFFTTAFVILALLVGTAGAAPAVHAAIGSACSEENDSACDPATSYCELIQNSPQLNTCVPNSQKAADAAKAQANLTATVGGTQTAADIAATKTPTDPNLGKDAGSQYSSVMIWIMSLFAWLVGVAAITLDNAVYYTVVTMGDYVSKLSAIGVAWRILRDLANILLIFGFIGSGIAIILNVDQYGFGTKLLPKLLIAAVLINFSLFVSEAMIDGTNLVATQFYTQINGGKPSGAKNFDKVSVQNDGISNKIMSQVGLQTIYGNGAVKTEIFQAGNTWVIGFMAILLFIVTAFVMFSLAFILIARFVALIFLILVSPVAFMGWAVPWLEYRMSQWWKHFTEQIITAPVLLLLLYVALAVITDAHFLTGFCIPAAGSTNLNCTPDWTGFANGNFTGFASMMLSFLVAMGLLMIVVIKAKSMSAVGADLATKGAGKLTFGATAWAGRATVGTAIGRGLLGNRLIKRGAVSDNRFIKYGSRALSFTGKRLQNRTFDVRNMPGAQSGLGSLGINAGAPSQLTAKQLQEKQYGLKPTKEWFRESSKEHEKAAADLKRKDILATGAPGALQSELKKMSDDELAELKGIRQGQDRLIQALRPTAYDSLMKNKNLLDSEKSQIKTKWEAQFATHATSAAALGRMTEDERVALGGKILEKREVYENLTADDFDNIRSAKLQPGEKTTIATYVRGVIAAGVPPALAADLAAAAVNPKFKAYYSIP
ncbi:MAG: hypothetical protein WCS97_02320 [Candidatus Paceibacterota bacterium]